MQVIPEVGNNTPFINSAEFVKMTVYNEYGNTSNGGISAIYTFSSAYKDETISGTTYEALGGLLSVGAQPRDIRVTQGMTSVSLSGVSGNNIAIVLGTRIKGSKLEILRGFYGNTSNTYYNLQNTYNRFTGIITSYNISNEYDNLNHNDTYTVTINASSYKAILENRIAGRKTNKSSWQFFNTTDSSMNNVYSIADQQFDFGKPVTATATTGSAASTETSQAVNNEIDTTGGGGF